MSGADNDDFIDVVLSEATGTVRTYYGYGSPEGVVTALPGSGYFDLDGGAGVTFYVKETGSGNTGWDAK
jgi:hypothetical protein